MAKLLKPDQALKNFVWSSWLDYLKTPSKRPAWLRVDRLLGKHGIPKDRAADRRELEQRMEASRKAEDVKAYFPIR